MAGKDLRTEILRRHGARGGEVEELLAYTANRFEVSNEIRTQTYPLLDEQCVGTWQRYARDAESIGVFECLRRNLVQLKFPIASGISQSPAYQAATRRGELPSQADAQGGLSLEEPAGLRLLVHATPAGRIPVLIVPNRNDFESILRALTRRNEPEVIPPAVGATIVAGYNNWDRVREYREAWEKSNPAFLWMSLGFSEMMPKKHLYQDRFILLSSGCYSDVAASSLGLRDDEWLEKSIAIRLEHECAHYFTRRVFGTMRNAVHDELIADFMGIVAAEGRYRADWFLRFLGLEDYPRYRRSGRLGSYRGDPPLSDEAFSVLRSLVRSAALNLEAADRQCRGPFDVAARARILCCLCELTIEEISGDDGGARLAESFAVAAG